METQTKGKHKRHTRPDGRFFCLSVATREMRLHVCYYYRNGIGNSVPCFGEPLLRTSASTELILYNSARARKNEINFYFLLFDCQNGRIHSYKSLSPDKFIKTYHFFLEFNFFFVVLNDDATANDFFLCARSFHCLFSRSHFLSH